MDISFQAATVGALGVIVVGLLAFLANWQRDYLRRLSDCETRLNVVEKENAGLRSEKLALEEAVAKRDRQIERLTERVAELESHIQRIERRDSGRSGARFGDGS